MPEYGAKGGHSDGYGTCMGQRETHWVLGWVGEPQLRELHPKTARHANLTRVNRGSTIERSDHTDSVVKYIISNEGVLDFIIHLYVVYSPHP